MRRSSGSLNEFSRSIVARDGAAAALTALGMAFFISKGLDPIVAGAGPPLFFVAILTVAWPAMYIARCRGYHGPVAAACWGALLAAPMALVALFAGSAGETARCFGLGLVGGILTWLAVKAQALPTLLLPKRYHKAAAYLIALLVCAGLFGIMVYIYSPGGRSDSSSAVMAVEVPLRTPADRADLLAILNRHAHADGLHVDDGSQQWIEFRRGPHPDESPWVTNILTKSIDVSVWRGSEDNDLVALMDDGGHLGSPWIMFFEGEQPVQTKRMRLRLLADINARWPEARNVPVMPNGSLPLAKDLVWTGKTYVLKSERINDYKNHQAEQKMGTGALHWTVPDCAKRKLKRCLQRT